MRAVAGLLLMSLTVGCASELDTAREPVDTGTFGEIVLTLACKRVAYLEDLEDGDGTVDVRGDEFREVCRLGLAPPAEAPDSLKALQAKREALAAAVDATFPETFLGQLDAYLTSNEFLALYDDGAAIAAIDSLSGFMKLMAGDEASMQSLERLNQRLGYKPIEPSLGIVRAVVNYPGLHELLLVVTDSVVEGGSARAEFQNLVAAAAATMRAAEATEEPADPQRSGRLALELLLTERELLGTERSIPLVRRDWRGLAKVATVGGELPAPFVDTNADGLADTDEVGRFIDAQGTQLEPPTPFALPAGDEAVPWNYRDAAGRALVADEGPPLYEFVDLDRTVFGALVRDGIELFDPQKGTALDLLRGSSALLGPRQMTTKTFQSGEELAYRGYDTSDAPLLDLLYGYLQLLRDPNISDTLALARTLLVEREAEVARVSEAMVETARLADEHPEAQLEEGSPIFDDLVPVVRAILADPGLTRDLLRAMEQPEVAELGLRFRDYLLYKDQFVYDADQNVVGSFATPVERSEADSGFNRSLMQRLLHLIADSNGAVLCNKDDAGVNIPVIGGLLTYDACDLFRIDNIATFFVQSIAYAKDGNGNVIIKDGQPLPKADLAFDWNDNRNNLPVAWAVNDGLIEDLAGITGFRTHPTPGALSRSLFLPEPTEQIKKMIDPPTCADGHLYTDAHGGTLPVWEVNGFYDQIRPIVQAFADHGQEQLFVDLLVVLHNHWPSRESVTHQQRNPDDAGYAWASNLVSYEPLIAEVLERRTLLDALVQSAPAFNATTAAGKDFITIVGGMGRYLLTPQPGLTDRLGRETSQTADGRPVEELSPWQVLADAYAAKSDRIASSGSEGQAWRDSAADLVDVLVRGDAGAEGYRFRNPRVRGVGVALIDFVSARLAAHDAAGDRQEWLSQELIGDAEEMLSGPLFAGAADFVLSLQASPEARAQLESLLAYLVNEAEHNESFRASLTGMADLFQLALDDRDFVPIAQVVGQALEPSRGWLDAQLTFINRARRADDDQTLTAMLRNLYVVPRAGHTAVGDLIDGISEVKRARPWEDLGERYTAADYRALLDGLAQFLNEEKRGLRKFIRIIEDRNK